MAVKFKDYYEVLDVPRTAGPDDIKKAFRRLARIYHPDVAKGVAGAEEKFKEINEAYDVLSTPDKRRKYDHLGPNWKQGADFRPPDAAPGGAGTPRSERFEFESGAGYSDFFEEMFGRRSAPGEERFPRNRTAGRDPGFSERGEDVEGEIMITLQEAVHGSVRSVTLRRNEPCRDCGGNGERWGRHCQACSGSGYVLKTETHQVKVPPGITEGQQLRIAGRGRAGRRGGAAGDLYLQVHLMPDPDFQVEDHNLVCEVGVAPWEAVLGANISVPTPGGPVNIKLPAGTQQGQKFRVRGHGLPQRTGPNGDLIVVADLALPKAASEEERRLWEQLARVSKFNPRGK